MDLGFAELAPFDPFRGYSETKPVTGIVEVLRLRVEEKQGFALVHLASGILDKGFRV